MSQIQVPKGWSLSKLNDICKKITDGDHQTPPRQLTGKMLLSAKNIRNGKIDFKNIQYVSQNDFEISRKRCNPEDGDILFSCVGSIGRIAVVDKNSDFMLVRTVALLKPNDKILPKYLEYFLRSGIAQNEIFSMVKGSAVQHIYLNQIKKISIFYPYIQIQKKIIKKLDQVLGQLEEKEKEIYSFINYKKLIKSEAILVQNIYDNILSQKKHKKWQKKPLGSLIIKSQNGMTGRPSEKPPGIPRLGITSVTHGTFGFINENECKFQEIEESKIENYQIHENDILICRQNGNKDFVGKAVVYRGNTKPLIFSDSLIRFQIKTNEIFSEFLMMFLNSTHGRIMIEPYCKTTAGNYSINSTNLKKIEVVFPDPDTQKRLILLKNENLEKIHQAQKEISVFLTLKEQNLLKLKNVKNSILNLAISGKLVN